MQYPTEAVVHVTFKDSPKEIFQFVSPREETNEYIIEFMKAELFKEGRKAERVMIEVK